MPRFVAITAAAWALTCGLALGTQEGGSRRLPPHDYSLVMPAGERRAEEATSRICREMTTELAKSRVLPPGFPQPGFEVRTSSADMPGGFDIRCSALQTQAEGCACIRLGSSSYVQLSTVDFPDSRAYLFEVFLFERPPKGALDRNLGYSMTRVVVGHPFFGKDLRFGPGLHPADVLDALQRGLLRAGARPLRLR